MSSELTVVIKSEDRTYRQKFLIYEQYTVSEDDPVINACKQEARKQFDGQPDSVQIKIHMEMETD